MSYSTSERIVMDEEMRFVMSFDSKSTGMVINIILYETLVTKNCKQLGRKQLWPVSR
jgi:hypothetical protein